MLNKAERIAIIITAAFILLSIGYYYGLARTESTYVTVEKQVSNDAVMQGGDDFAPKAETENITEKTDINKASTEELAGLPGIGDVLAGRIIDYREENGEFENIENIMDISGIGEGIFNRVKDLITV